MTKDALIIGGSTAGLQAALDLADSGLSVHLIESSPFLGREGAAAIPQHLLKAQMLEAAKHPKINIWTNTRINRIEGSGGRFHVELRRHPRYVDLTKCTACGDCLEVCPVTAPGTEHKAIHLLDSQPECAAIDKLGKPPCANACPGGIHVQGYVALTAQGRFQEAINLIRNAIPFPGICGRVCTHPCEINCRRAEVDKPVAIRLLKRFLADWELENERPETEGGGRHSPFAIRHSKRVAVVGAGPGGMAVAERLARGGYPVTVFEKLPVIGGMMAVGIPEYRLPREVIAREYQRIQNLGVDIRLNTAIGPEGEHSLDDLFNMDYAAVCLAVGAHKSRGLRIPGEDLPGVVHGIELLESINLGRELDAPRYKIALEKLLHRGAKTRVAVLGGGNTAMDVSRSLRRLGLEDVRVLYRRTRAEMPSIPEEVEDAEAEGVELEFLVSPVRVLGDDENGLTGLECIRMKLGEPDASGRPRPVPIAGSEFVVDLDVVVLAIGQLPDLSFLGQDHDIAITRHERINVADISFMTSRPGLFAVGDAVTRDKMAVIEAIGMGKQAAAAIDDYLMGRTPHETIVDAREVPIARREMTAEELAPRPPVPVPTIPLEQRTSTFAEVELAYSPEDAIAEAQRCLVCGPCSECMACVEVCEPGAIVHEEYESFIDLDIGAVIYAGDPAHFERFLLPEEPSIYRVPPDEALPGSAAAARAMLDLFAERQFLPGGSSAAAADGPARIGVVLCQCGGEISEAVDTHTLRDQAAAWPNVIHAQTLPFSCSPEAAAEISDMIAAHDLSKVVLAACTCCSLDQVCYSCTYQRVRCKDNLGVFASLENSSLFEFVNIREQCAWAHRDDPQAATAKATALVSAAVAGARAAAARPVEAQPIERSALILGNGAAAYTCRVTLSGQGIAVRHIEGLPDRVRRTGGQYAVTLGETIHKASALALSPSDEDEAAELLSVIQVQRTPKPVECNAPDVPSGLASPRPGVYYGDFALDPETAGYAVSARVAAWLGRAGKVSPTVAVVDPARCRACSTCIEICEFGAPEIREENGLRFSWIDPIICTGCGTCAAHCPSGAITAGESSEAQIEARLEAVLG